eukprot:2307024-Pyramimonas_sp.AAC.1
MPTCRAAPKQNTAYEWRVKRLRLTGAPVPVTTGAPAPVTARARTTPRRMSGVCRCRCSTHRRLVGDLDAHLQQADGELRVWLRCDPEAEILVDLLRLDQKLLHLLEVRQAQMHVLQQHPLALHRRARHVLARDHLLALPHAHAVRLDLLLLGQVLDELGRIRPRGEQANERHPAHRLQPGGLHVERHRLHEHAAERLRDVVLRGDERAVLAHRAHHAHLLKL